ncbi:MAG TPA: hypothetical protein VJW20_18140 [Candidatus Angelobacter sp.]|nr:hypothetical protein [Candidatus Angelobacter sp.]
MEARLQAGGGIAALVLVFLAGGNAAFLAGKAGPISKQGGSSDAKTAGVGRESSGANGCAIAIWKVRYKPAIVDAGQAHELGTGGSATKLTCGRTDGLEDLRAGEHGAV